MTWKATTHEEFKAMANDRCTNKECVIGGCDKSRVSANGLCKVHYQRFFSGKNLFSPIRSCWAGSNESKFLKDVVKTDSCWLWKGNLRSGGYGAFTPRTFTKTSKAPSGLAHRWAYEHWNGPIPHNLVVNHKCRVRNCVNPEHLNLLSNRENILIGTGASARNAKKTRCAQGHPYSSDNIIWLRGKWRRCKICNKIQCAKYKERSLNLLREGGHHG
jgi:hypothetical protein